MTNDPYLQIIISAKDATGKAFRSIHADVGRLAKSFGFLNAAIAGIGVVGLAKSFIDAGVEMDRFRRSMEGISGSAVQTAGDIAYLEKETNRLGQIFRDQIKGFNLLSAATKGTSLEGQGLRDMYTDLMESMTAFQLSQDDAYNSVRAIQQMMAKGTIQAEEFRGQFGERIPIAFEAMKIATGLAADELQDMMKKGKLLSEDVVPNMLRVMSVMARKGSLTGADSAQAEINRLINSFYKLRVAIMDAGYTKEFASVLSGFNSGIREFLKTHDSDIQDFVQATSKSFNILKADVMNIFDAVATAYNRLKDTAAGNAFKYGVLGYLLFGTTPGQLIMVIHTLSTAVNRIRAQGLVSSGVVGQKTIAEMSDTDLIKFLKDFDSKNDDPFYMMTLNAQKYQDELDKVEKRIIQLQNSIKYELGRVKVLEKPEQGTDTSVLGFVTNQLKEFKYDWDASGNYSTANRAIYYTQELNDLLKQRVELTNKIAMLEPKISEEKEYQLRQDKIIQATMDALYNTQQKKAAGELAAEEAKGLEFRKSIIGGNEISKEYAKQLKKIAKENKTIGAEFFDSFFSGFESKSDLLSGLIGEQLQKVSVELFAEKIGGAIEGSLTHALYTSFDSLSMEASEIFGAAFGNIATGVIGIGVGAIFNNLFGGSSGPTAKEIRIQHLEELNERLRDLSDEIHRNTMSLQNQYSTRTTELFNLSEEFLAGIKSGLEDSKTWIDTSTISGIKYFFDFTNKSIQEAVEGAQQLYGVSVSFNDTLREFLSVSPAEEFIYVSFEKFLTELNNFQTGVIESAQDLATSAGDAFRTESEIQKREIQKTGKDFLISLVESFKAEGSQINYGTIGLGGLGGLQLIGGITDDYISSLTDLGTYQEIANKLLVDFSGNLEEYAQIQSVVNSLNSAYIDQTRELSQSLSTSITDWRQGIIRRDWGMSDWITEFNRLGTAINMLNVTSDAYQSNAISYAEKQFDVLQKIADISLSQLSEMKSSRESLADQIWEITSGTSSDTASVYNWLNRYSDLFSSATGTLNTTDISKFQSFIPEFRDVLIASGYSYTEATNQAVSALNTLLDKVDTGIMALNDNIDNIVKYSPVSGTGVIQPLNINLNIDGRVIAQVVIDQLNTNGDLIQAVRNA